MGLNHFELVFDFTANPKIKKMYIRIWLEN